MIGIAIISLNISFLLSAIYYPSIKSRQQFALAKSVGKWWRPAPEGWSKLFPSRQIFVRLYSMSLYSVCRWLRRLSSPLIPLPPRVGSVVWIRNPSPASAPHFPIPCFLDHRLASRCAVTPEEEAIAAPRGIIDNLE